MRSFDMCLPTMHWNVFRHFLDDCTFFVSTVQDQDSDKVKALSNLYPKHKIFVEKFESQPKLDDGFPPWELHNPARYYSHEPYAISASPQAILGQLWQLEQGYRLYLGETHEKDLADVVIRCRPDLWFHSLRRDWITEPDSAGINRLGRNRCITPCWGRFGGINDRFAIMGPDAAFCYFYTFSKVKELMDAGCPLHPESLVKAALNLGKAILDDSMEAFFSTLRTDGQMRRPEIWAEDFLHAILR